MEGEDAVTRYGIQDVDEKFDARVASRHGGEYVIEINGRERRLEVLAMDARGIEFVLDGRYHRARYLAAGTRQMDLVVDNVPVTVHANEHFDEVVFKNSGGAAAGGAQTALKSQIPGKVVSIAVAEGAAVKKGDPVCTLESMKMQVAVKAHRDGTVRGLKIKEGATVAKGDAIAEIE